jgi:hypothetical protein
MKDQAMDNEATNEPQACRVIPEMTFHAGDCIGDKPGRSAAPGILLTGF